MDFLGVFFLGVSQMVVVFYDEQQLLRTSIVEIKNYIDDEQWLVDKHAL